MHQASEKDWGRAGVYLSWHRPRLGPGIALSNIWIALRRRVGSTGYETGFIEHYLIPLLYPPGLSRGLQIVLGGLVLTVNIAVYGWLAWSLRRR